MVVRRGFASELEEILEDAIARIPQVARMIAALSTEEEEAAMEIVERSYRQTAVDLRLGRGGERWVSAVMVRLRTETELRRCVDAILSRTA